jgi:hypothetical protein
MKLLITAPIILLMLASCGGQSVEFIVGGQGALHLVNNLKNIESCEAYRIDDSYPGESEVVFDKKIHGYGVISDPVNLDLPDRVLLSQALVDSKTYFHYSEPIDCLFRPGVAFRFSDASNELNLLICFSCNELEYFSSGEKVGGSYFRSVKIKELAKKLFPDDPSIQSLK